MSPEPSLSSTASLPGSPGRAEYLATADAAGSARASARLADASLAAATLLDAVGLSWIGAHAGSSGLLWAIAAHLLAVAVALFAGGASRSQRLLSAALTLTLPLVGATIAAHLLGIQGRNEIAQADPRAKLSAPNMSPAELRRMADGLSCCEALLASAPEERGAILATLSRNADRESVGLLRWALSSSHPELAVEAALALEDIGATFDSDLAGARAKLAESPSADSALAVAGSITEAIEAGVADAPLVPGLADEARDAYNRAAEMAPARFEAIAIGRARLELAVLRPDTALEVIDRALQTASGSAQVELNALRQDAVLASHSMPWEGPSSLATYRRAVGRGVTRRHSLVKLLGTEVTRGRA